LTKQEFQYISCCFFRFRAYDTNNGIEVAWNVVKLNRVPPSERKRIKTEVKLLKDIEHKNVIKYFNSWVDREKEQIIFITEIMSSGSLKEYVLTFKLQLNLLNQLYSFQLFNA